jgi:hypothetical protein
VHGAARRLPSNTDVASKAADGSAELSDIVALTDRELDDEPQISRRALARRSAGWRAEQDAKFA